MKQTTVVVLMYGLPGAGKTSLCEQIVEKAPQLGFTTIHICYDRLLPGATGSYIPRLNKEFVSQMTLSASAIGARSGRRSLNT